MNKKILTYSIIGTITGFLNGLFGSGGGTVLVPCLQKFIKIEPHKAHATAIAVILPLSMISTFIYLKDNTIDIKSLLFICAGGVIGGFIGAKFLNKIPTKWLHKFFGIFIIASAIKMIL